MREMLKTDAIYALKSDIERIKKIYDLPSSEQERWATGIAKLEQRIDQEREACGLSAETFVVRLVQILDQVKPCRAISIDIDALDSILQSANLAWQTADESMLELAFTQLETEITKANSSVEVKSLGSRYLQQDKLEDRK